MPVSLKDVAKAAGVSVSTVSYVVNGRPNVTAATRQRVQQALDELNYRPNLVARGLQAGRSGIIALAVPTIDAPYFGELARHIISEAAQRSYTVLIDQTDGLVEREQDLLEDIGPRLIDGLIFSPLAMGPGQLRSRVVQTPLVLLGEQVANGPADHVAIDNVAAARAGTAHLIEIGRRRIAAIGCGVSKTSHAAQQRYVGYARALADAGLAAPADPVGRNASRDRTGGASAVEALLRAPSPPDALFCYNDLMALGAIRGLLKQGVRVPEDVAVVGIDDIEDGRFSTPSLTTISPDKRRMAHLVVDLLLSRITDGANSPPREMQVPFTLEVRESTASASRLAGPAFPGT